MAKNTQRLNKQVNKVNIELERLGLQEVTGNQERALVDSAYDQMGLNNIWQQASALVAVLLPTLTVLITTQNIGVLGAMTTVGVALILFIGLIFTGTMGFHQSAKAIELILIHRSSINSQPAKTSPNVSTSAVK